MPANRVWVCGSVSNREKLWKGAVGMLAEKSVVEWSDACSCLGLSLLPWAWDAAANPGLRKWPGRANFRRQEWRQSAWRGVEKQQHGSVKTSSWSCLTKPLVMLMKIPSLHQSLVLLLSISPLERDLIKLPNCPLPPEISTGWDCDTSPAWARAVPLPTSCSRPGRGYCRLSQMTVDTHI